MKTYKKIMAEGLVLAGLLGMFGCNINGESRSVSLEYVSKSEFIYERTSKLEGYLKTQGFKLMSKDYSHWSNTGDIYYEKDKTNIIIKMELYSGNDINVDIKVSTFDNNFEFSDLEKEIHKIMTEKTK